MNGGRQLYACPKCGKKFFYWVQETTAQPKVKCSFCDAESFPKGEPPPPPAPAPVEPAKPPAPEASVAPAPPEAPVN
jgi:DNA-directed RNA polymerase subunit RPC12/RpoP